MSLTRMCVPQLGALFDDLVSVRIYEDRLDRTSLDTQPDDRLPDSLHGSLHVRDRFSEMLDRSFFLGC